MKTRNYALLCGLIAVVLAATLVYVPAISDLVEQVRLGFLSRNAG